MSKPLFRRNFENGDGIVNYELTEEGYRRLMPCPHCGTKANTYLHNTWTPSYWMACDCGAQMHDERPLPRVGQDRAAHLRSAHHVFKQWNKRNGYR